jgi:hypothetical protein
MKRGWIATALVGIAAVGIAAPTGARDGSSEPKDHATLSVASGGDVDAAAKRAIGWNGKGGLDDRFARKLIAPAQASQGLLGYIGTTANDGVRIYRGRNTGLIIVTHPPAILEPGVPCLRVSRHKVRCAPRSIAGIVGNTGPGNDRLKVGKKVKRPIGMGGWWGRDRLGGGGGNDVLLGQNGRDRLKGKRGRDIVCGGAGRDRTSGGPGNDAGCKALR